MLREFKMDIEKIKKINDLALDLLSKGMATDRIQAAEMAEKLLSKEAIPNAKPMDNTQAKEPIPQEPVQVETKQNFDTSEISKVVAQQSESVMAALKEFGTKFGEMRKELDELKQKIIDLRPMQAQVAQAQAPVQQPIQPVQPVQPQAPVQQPVQAQPIQPPVQAPPTGSNPMYGKFQPGDVDMEKIFYYGNKK